MTNEQRVQCHAIIHAAAVAAGGSNAVPVPVLGVAADMAALVGMAVGLASVFGECLTEDAAKKMSIEALKRALLDHPVKVLSKELVKIIPFFGSVYAATVSVGLVETAGWNMVSELEAALGNA